MPNLIFLGKDIEFNEATTESDTALFLKRTVVERLNQQLM